MMDTSLLRSWLSEDCTPSGDGKYVHRLLREDAAQREFILLELRATFEHAHNDARRHLRGLLADSLDPLGECTVDPTAGYPERLNILTLQGYFGEVLTGVVAEAFAHFGKTGWRVPAFLFRFHDHAFDRLEMMRQNAGEPGVIPGRSGEDCVAFLCTNDQQIVASLICEAKCTLDHDSNLIAEAHRQASSPYSKPLSICQIIEVLHDYCDDVSKQWIMSLRNLFHQDTSQEYERHDLVCYVCGRSPIRKDSWIPAEQPDSRYSGGRKLEAVEVHLNDVGTMIYQVYGIN